MNPQEAQSYTVMKKLEYKQMLKNEALKILVNANRTPKDQEGEFLKFSNIKSSIENFRYLRRVYKNIGEFNIVEELASHFNKVMGSVEDIQDMIVKGFDDARVNLDATRKSMPFNDFANDKVDFVSTSNNFASTSKLPPGVQRRMSKQVIFPSLSRLKEEISDAEYTSSSITVHNKAMAVNNINSNCGTNNTSNFAKACDNIDVDYRGDPVIIPGSGLNLPEAVHYRNNTYMTDVTKQKTNKAPDLPNKLEFDQSSDDIVSVNSINDRFENFTFSNDDPSINENTITLRKTDKLKTEIIQRKPIVKMKKSTSLMGCKNVEVDEPMNQSARNLARKDTEVFIESYGDCENRKTNYSYNTQRTQEDERLVTNRTQYTKEEDSVEIEDQKILQKPNISQFKKNNDQ